MEAGPILMEASLPRCKLEEKIEVISKPHLRPNGCVAPRAGFASDFINSGAAQTPVNAHILAHHVC